MPDDTPTPGDDDIVLDVYGIDQAPATALTAEKAEFLPWHHPIKQIVRKQQWQAQTERLLTLHRAGDLSPLRYFTLPGPDLLDVRVIAEVCQPRGISVQYFGFDDSSGGGPHDAWLGVEAELRQAGQTTGMVRILPDRLEDIAKSGSHAESQLAAEEPFDIVNLDICGNLGFKAAGVGTCALDALRRLVFHQLRATKPWLLFVTTRVHNEALNEPADYLKSALKGNLEMPNSTGFAEALADSIGCQTTELASRIGNAWQDNGIELIRIFSISLGKYLMQFLHGQANFQAKLELASAYAYKVGNDGPDMAALAFRIFPQKMVQLPVSTGGAIQIPQLEVALAEKMVRRFKKIADLDDAFENEDVVRCVAISETLVLLRKSKYNIEKWVSWLESHPIRPIARASICLT